MESSKNKFGKVIYDEVAHDVFSVEYENQNLYFQELTTNPAQFVGYTATTPKKSIIDFAEVARIEAQVAKTQQFFKSYYRTK